MKYAVRSGKPVTIQNLVKIMTQAYGLDSTEIFNLGFYPYHKRERFVLRTQQPTVPNWKSKISLVNGINKLLAERGRGILN